MALVPEDGTGRTDANSYQDLATARAYAEERGLSLPTADDAAEDALVQAADYVNSYRHRFQGTKINGDMSMQWPRTGVTKDRYAVPSDSVPSEVLAAQVHAAVDYGAGLDLLPTGPSAPVRRERVGPLETEYATSSARGSSKPQAHDIEALLQPLFKRGGMTRAVRI